MTGDAPILEVEGLQTEFLSERGTVKAVNDVSFEIDRGETFGIVGESGAGKSVTALSVMGLVDSPGRITDGEVRYKGEDLLAMPEEKLRSLRGEEIAMIFQDPMTALNPAYQVGEQIMDVVLEHREVTREQARERTIDLLEDVGIPDPESRVDDYPHQFSGGMRQRALIAMALACDPDLLIADEPTTALDVTIQAQILDLLEELQEKYNTAILLITHNMGVVAEICDRVAIMYAGKKIEEAPIEDVFESPRHPYTVGLFKSIPRIDDPRVSLDTIPGSMPDLVETPRGCSFHPRCEHATEACTEAVPPLETVDERSNHTSACIRVDEIDFESETTITGSGVDKSRQRNTGDTLLEVDGLRKYFDPESQEWYDKLLGNEKHVHAVDDVSLQIRKGETLGLVGESGCGKSTLGRTLLQLYEPDQGTVLYAGEDLTEMDKKRLKEQRSNLQIIFQDPFSSLNPRRTVKNIIGRPLEIHGKVDDEDEKVERVEELLEQVGLDAGHVNRYPHEFSGGQKQRIGIARALAVEPDFIVADEPVSALDVSVQAQILNLLMDLQDEFGLTYLFIAHDLNVVQHISDRIAVMYLGELVEVGGVTEVFEPPYHPYTEALLSAIPQPSVEQKDERIVLEGDVPSPIDPPSGCRFHTRCPYAMDECSTTAPDSIEIEDGPTAKCHLFDKEMMASKDESVNEIIDSQRRIIDTDTAVRQSTESD
jgi:peptide/nickel transport system ATP-binding protein